MSDLLTTPVAGVPLWNLFVQGILLGLLLWKTLRDSTSRVNDFLDEHADAIRKLRTEVGRLQPPRAVNNRTPAQTFDLSEHGQFDSGIQSRPSGSVVKERPVAPPAQAPVSHAVPVTSAPQRYYAKSPEVDGTFKLGNIHADAAYDSLYVITVSPGGGNARVTLYGNPDQLLTALQSPYIYLDPVCSYERQPQPHASRVIVIHDGEAALEDDRWRVKQKLEIKFA